MSSSEQDKPPQDLPWESWPRLYLDTAELLAMAGGRTDERLVTELLYALVRTQTVLVISRDHIQDIQGASVSTREGFFAALQRFPVVAAADKEPGDIEPWTDGPMDISLRFVSDARGLFQQPAAEPYLRLFADVQTALYTACVQTQKARRAAAPLSRHAKDCIIHGPLMIAHEPATRAIDELIADCEQNTKNALGSEEREAVAQHLQPWANLMGGYKAKVKLTDEQHWKLAYDIAATIDGVILQDAPGTSLARCLARGLAKNPTRNPLRSDSVDNFHASYFPYVDVATCDREAFACISQQITAIHGLRPTKLFRNGQLRQVIDAVAQLQASQ